MRAKLPVISTQRCPCIVSGPFALSCVGLELGHHRAHEHTARFFTLHQCKAKAVIPPSNHEHSGARSNAAAIHFFVASSAACPLATAEHTRCVDRGSASKLTPSRRRSKATIKQLSAGGMRLKNRFLRQRQGHRLLVSRGVLLQRS